MSYEPKHLTRWTMPDSYFGETWPNYFYAPCQQNRDSDALTRSNFAECVRLGGENEDVVVVREGHWAVGWVEWIAIHQDNEKALKTADELAERLEDYPVLNDDAFSELEYTECCEYWERCNVRERIELIQRADNGISIFAARRSEIPEDDNGALFEVLRGI